ncbi:MAG: NTP/NDP exchange transporter [Rickettsiaceae bacterium]|nr:NTP/NDP exchange transporter [Rickettsiaceae bacterium]
MSFSDYFLRLRNSAFRDLIWPIRSGELRKFVPMALMMFTILLNQNFVRGMKDSIIMTLVGPEAIGFIKLWCEMPAGVIFVVIYAKMCNIVTTETAFRYVLIFFLSFFAFFAFVLFPNHSVFHPDPNLVESTMVAYGHLKWFIIIWSKWSFVLFYVMGELWPVIILGLFWQLANKTTKTEEARRFYSFFTLFGQINLLVSGVAISYFASSNHFLVPVFGSAGECNTEVTLKSMMVVVLCCGVVTLLLHRFVEIEVIYKNSVYKSQKRSQKLDVLKLGLRDSAKMILSSKYLGLICVLISSYNVAVILIEGLWFAKVRELYPSTEGFMQYQGEVLFWTGVSALIFAFLGSAIIRRLGWFFGAVLTPVIICTVGGLFFLSVVMEDRLVGLFNSTSFVSVLAIIVLIGSLQNIFGKGVKYSLFDTTKEMVYIPLDTEMKIKGKAAVDVVGTKIGKSLGSILPFITFTIFPNAKYDDIAGFLLSVFGTVCIIWIYAVYLLSREYQSLLKGEGNNVSIFSESKE